MHGPTYIFWADLTPVSLEVDMELEDCQSQLRRIRQRLIPRACWRAGAAVADVVPAEAASPFPNPMTVTLRGGRSAIFFSVSAHPCDGGNAGHKRWPRCGTNSAKLP